MKNSSKKTAVEQLNEMLSTNFLSNSSSDRDAAKKLINKGTAVTGWYTGSGRFTKSSSASLSLLNGLVSYEEYNVAPKGGVGGDRAKLIEIDEKAVNSKYDEFLKEIEGRESSKKAKVQSRNDRMKAIAKNNGFDSVAALKRANDAIAKHNDERMSRALIRRDESFKEKYGQYPTSSISDKVRASRIELEFDCEFKEYYY